jgi:hypothetical protein
MVEYALLAAGNSLQLFAANAMARLERLDWHAVAVIVLVLVALRVAAWAFKPST